MKKTAIMEWQLHRPILRTFGSVITPRLGYLAFCANPQGAYDVMERFGLKVSDYI